ncbi:type II toxin-antitoxin system RelE/ParE family toxin (plasmid) [Bradyrhizobium barranii]|uniref:Type II toxin-antitoxin system RelE/ParE family toxin n=1 Tax=Bradyrhizobium barranii TaxID=2992140 RepID=A0ABY3R2J0_9BRAD|nr:type II toxin-antitoxin system RelE/ParE family toxin [Bradyrhizobium japonicum]UFW92126.1 type II toxin-antitoxin system RelE/ParE family toxin [Bradyrhizobium japonicum]
MKLVWSRFALFDRDGIFSYIEAENPRAAVHVDEQIANAARRLLDFPDSGRPGRVAGTRELVIPRTSYVIEILVPPESLPILEWLGIKTSKSPLIVRSCVDLEQLACRQPVAYAVTDTRRGPP